MARNDNARNKAGGADMRNEGARRAMAHIIVVGNEKGGAGKSTVSMHVATALARMGHSVSALDLDLSVPLKMNEEESL